MAWLSEIAFRAEDMLNKLDQNAATVLLSTATSSSPEDPNHTPNHDTLKEVMCDGAGNSSTMDSALESNLTLIRPSSTSTLDVSSSREISPQSTEPPSPEMVRRELSAMRFLVSTLKAERDKFKAEVNRMVDMEQDLRAITNERDLLRIEMHGTKEVNQKAVRERLELELSLAQAEQGQRDLTDRLATAKQDVVRSNEELSNYRARAQHSLQLKERLIEELRSSSALISTTHSGATDTSDELTDQHKSEDRLKVLTAELDAVRRELEANKEYVESLESKMDKEQWEHKQQLANLRQEIAQVVTEKQAARQELAMKTQELNFAREEMAKETGQLFRQLHDKDKELEMLMQQRQKLLAQSESADDLPIMSAEARIRSLTKALIQKQNSLESIATERNMLRLRLEKKDNDTTCSVGRDERPLVDNDMNHGRDWSRYMEETHPITNWIDTRTLRLHELWDDFGRRAPPFRFVMMLYLFTLHMSILIFILANR